MHTPATINATKSTSYTNLRLEGQASVEEGVSGGATNPLHWRQHMMMIWSYEQLVACSTHLLA